METDKLRDPNQKSNMIDGNSQDVGSDRTRWGKVADFFIGCLIVWGGSSLLAILSSMILSESSFSTATNLSLMYLLPIVFWMVVLAIFIRNKKRRFIAVGMMSVLLMPLLALGGCLLALSPLRN